MAQDTRDVRRPISPTDEEMRKLRIERQGFGEAFRPDGLHVQRRAQRTLDRLESPPKIGPPGPSPYKPLGPIPPEEAERAMRDRGWREPWIKGSPDYPFIPSPDFEKWRRGR